MKLSELKELAKKATPGPWEIDSKYDQIWNPQTYEYIGTEDSDCHTTQFIAAANPQVVLQLIERSERLKKVLKDWLSATPTDKDGKYCGINQSQAKAAAEVLTEMENS
jgi:hypothetical protein